MKLVIEDDAGTRSVVPFAADEIVVGRAAEGVAFRLTDRDVSRRHARFVRAGGGVFVEDLGSLTGTRVNGEPLAGRRRLRAGDLVQIGDYDLALLAEEDAGAPGTPPPLPGPSGAAASAADPARRSTARLALLAGLVALVLGLVAGLAVGGLGEPPPPPAAQER